MTLQFDDSYNLDYTCVFPLLEQYGFKGSFGYITERSQLGIEGEAWKMQEIALAGHEVQDHTTRHDYMWGTHVDTLDDGVNDWIEWTFATPAQWDSLCLRSLFILDSLGIEAIGWNHPGGTTGSAVVPGHPGWIWRGGTNDTLYQVIGSHYPYALGCCVFPQTAHLNLRGHNYPERRPFFDVPHVAIDYRSLADIKTGIADAVASGLWYLAAQHVSSLDRVTKLESLVVWLDANDIEVLTCREGWSRIHYGVPDPSANQIPQAEMLTDMDGNGKPDGFTGGCEWDTVSAAPIEGVRCLTVFGNTEYFCYGPELGPNAFSVWIRSKTGSPCAVCIVWQKMSFDWDVLGECWNTVNAGTEWALLDTCQHAQFLIEVEDEVDRIKFGIRLYGSGPILVARPELTSVVPAGIRQSCRIHAVPTLKVMPNPARCGSRLWIESGNTVGLYDVTGRCLSTFTPYMCGTGFYVSTRKLGPGVLFVRETTGPTRSQKVIVYR